jgi:predicted DCC family thiol-disulfide oxidoreductase YuxK
MTSNQRYWLWILAAIVIVVAIGFVADLLFRMTAKNRIMIFGRRTMARASSSSGRRGVGELETSNVRCSTTCIRSDR